MAAPGELTPGWRLACMFCWVGVLVALGAVWSASRQIGLATWWLGPPAQMQPPYVVALPFVPGVVVVAALWRRVRAVPWIGLAAAVAIAAVGIADLSRVRGLGVVELLVAGAGALVSVAAFGGRYRTAPTDDVDR